MHQNLKDESVLYNIDDNIFFDELAFASQGEFMDNRTDDFKLELGSKFDIKDFPRKK